MIPTNPDIVIEGGGTLQQWCLTSILPIIALQVVGIFQIHEKENYH